MKKIIALLLLSTPLFAATLPDHTMTPGKADPTLTANVLCGKSFTTSSIRNVPESLKKKIYAQYNVKNHEGYCTGTEGCEIDHLISLELGGSNDIKNLWPQSFEGPYSAHLKDKLENKLHVLVCTNQITLEEAQYSISTNWILAYKKYIGNIGN